MRILAVTSLRDEGPFLLEWLAWGRMIGISDILVYSNDCRDGSDAMLDVLAEAGVVCHERNPASLDPALRKAEGKGAGKSLQWQAFEAAWRHPLRKSADWMLCADLDEFPLIHCGEGRIPDLIAALPPDTDAVALPWRLFGHNLQASPPAGNVTAAFTRSAPAEMTHPIAASFFKTLFRPKAFARIGVHRPKQRPDSLPHWRGGGGEALAAWFAKSDQRLSLLGASAGAMSPAGRELVELHHYSLRSAQSFVVKSDRGLPNRSDKALDIGYWLERNYNSIENTAALRHQEALNAELARLRAIPQLAALEAEAKEWHQQQFARLMQQEPYLRLYGQCLHCASATALPTGLERMLYTAWGNLQR